MWTEARVETLLKRWGEGHSASQIAKELKVGTWPSRNAVIGKVHRLGLPRRAEPNRPTKLPPRKVAQSLTRAPRLNPVRMPPLPEDRQLAKLLPALGPELHRTTDSHCKFIPGDPAIDSRVCGRGTGHGPYCAQHIRLCYEPSKPKPRVRSERTDERRRWLRQQLRELGART